MKKCWNLFCLGLFFVAPLKAMEKMWTHEFGGDQRSSTTLSLAMYFELLNLIEGHKLDGQKQVTEYPHQPNQSYRVKKTQQPNTFARRQFSQHHK